jgi:hypothetical protein
MWKFEEKNELKNEEILGQKMYWKMREFLAQRNVLKNEEILWEIP